MRWSKSDSFLILPLLKYALSINKLGNIFFDYNFYIDLG